MRAVHAASFRRRRGNAESHNQFRIDPTHILELHEKHPLTYYSRMDWGASVCDRCRKLCFDEGWRCDRPECETAVKVGDSERGVVCRPFFCVACYSEAARIQSECLGAVVAEKANRETQRKSRTPNLRTNWRAEPGLLLGNDVVHFESLISAIIMGRLERVKEIVDHSEFSRHIQIDDTLMMLNDENQNNENTHNNSNISNETITAPRSRSRVGGGATSSSSPPPPPPHLLTQTPSSAPKIQNPNKISIYGKTPLLLAAEGGHRAIVTLLLERGANREASDIRHGLTPLMVASLHGHASVVDELAHASSSAGGGVNASSIDRLSASHGYSACHYAAAGGHAAVLRRLIKFGADVLVRTPQGRTPLIVAACNGHYEAVVELVGQMWTLMEVVERDERDEGEDEDEDEDYEEDEEEGEEENQNEGKENGDDVEGDENDHGGGGDGGFYQTRRQRKRRLRAQQKRHEKEARAKSAGGSATTNSVNHNMNNNNNGIETSSSSGAMMTTTKRSIALESLRLLDDEGYSAVDIAIARQHNNIVNFLQKSINLLVAKQI